MKVLLRLTTMTLAGLFAARGGWWWITAVMFFMATLAPIKPRGTRAASITCLVVAGALGVAFAVLALKGTVSPLLGVFAVYVLLQGIHEAMVMKQKGSASPA
jgi:hypothetical protein